MHTGLTEWGWFVDWGAQTRVAEECDTTVTAARTVLIAYSIQDYILVNDKKGRRRSSVP